MKLKDLIQLVFSSLMATNRLRTALGVLGVTIGVTLIVGGTIVLQSFMIENVNALEELGGNELWIVSGVRGRILKFTVKTWGRLTSHLTTEDIHSIMRQSRLIKGLAPVIQRSLLLNYAGDYADFVVRGTTSSYLIARDSKVVEGRFLTDYDITHRKKVCIIERAKNTQDFFGGQIPIGEKVFLNGHGFVIIGATETPVELAQPWAGHLLYLPLSTMQDLFGARKINLVIAKAIDAEHVLQATEQVEAILLQRYGPSQKFSILNFGSLLETVNRAKNLIERIILCIAGLSLLAGAIGITNIMYVSVLERIKEIGIIKAFGGKKKYIMVQFLLEAILISLTGGIVGVALGLVISLPVVLYLDLDYRVPLATVIFGFLLPVAVGILAGFSPARKAADLDPVAALRSEI